MQTNIVIAFAFLLFLTSIAAYDIYAAFFMPDGSTVSYILQDWARKFPAVGVAVGFVLGHLFWPVSQVFKNGKA